VDVAGLDGSDVAVETVDDAVGPEEVVAIVWTTGAASACTTASGSGAATTGEVGAAGVASPWVVGSGLTSAVVDPVPTAWVVTDAPAAGARACALESALAPPPNVGPTAGVSVGVAVGASATDEARTEIALETPAPVASAKAKVAVGAVVDGTGAA